MYIVKLKKSQKSAVLKKEKQELLNRIKAIDNQLFNFIIVNNSDIVKGEDDDDYILKGYDSRGKVHYARKNDIEEFKRITRNPYKIFK